MFVIIKYCDNSNMETAYAWFVKLAEMLIMHSNLGNVPLPYKAMLVPTSREGPRNYYVN